MKSEFLSDLKITNLPDKENVWRLDDTLLYSSGTLNRIVCVPIRFITDLASVPRVPIAYTLWGDRSHREATLHDYLYRLDSIPNVSRATADKIFLEAMKCRGKPLRIRWPMYLGVRIGGFGAYHKRKV